MPRALGELELTLLFALVAEGPDAPGLVLRRFVRARTGRDLAPGAVYTALSRLEARHLISSQLDEGDARRGGRPLRRYTLLHSGAVELNAAYRHIQAMSRGLAEPLLSLAGGAQGTSVDPRDDP